MHARVSWLVVQATMIGLGSSPDRLTNICRSIFQITPQMSAPDFKRGSVHDRLVAILCHAWKVRVLYFRHRFAMIFALSGLLIPSVVNAKPTIPVSTPAPTPTAATQPSYDAMSYGAKCDDKTDDTAAFNAVFAAAKANCISKNNVTMGQATVDFPPGKVCKLNSGITIDVGCVALRTNGATLDFSGIAADTAAVTTIDDDPASPDNDNLAVIDLKIVGPGQSTSSGTIGLLTGATGTTYIDLSATGFNYGVEVGSHSWVVSWINPQLFGNGTGWYCPPSLTDAGESMSIVNGVIYNNDIAIDTEGCEVNSSNTAFDFETESIANVAINGTGALRLANSHIEFNTLSGALFNLGGPNSYSYITAEGGQWQSDSQASPADLATVNNIGYGGDGGWGPWAQINDVFMVGLRPGAPCNAGSGFICSIGSNAQEVKYLNDRQNQGNILSSQPVQNGDVEIDSN